MDEGDRIWDLILFNYRVWSDEINTKSKGASQDLLKDKEYYKLWIGLFFI